jgi:hypothetical protein
MSSEKKKSGKSDKSEKHSVRKSTLPNKYIEIVDEGPIYICYEYLTIH